MQTLHSDRGGVFINSELTALADYLDVKQTSTAASSPNQNECCERNHAIVDCMMEKIIFQEPDMDP